MYRTTPTTKLKACICNEHHIVLYKTLQPTITSSTDLPQDSLCQYRIGKQQILLLQLCNHQDTFVSVDAKQQPLPRELQQDTERPNRPRKQSAWLASWSLMSHFHGKDIMQDPDKNAIKFTHRP